MPISKNRPPQKTVHADSNNSKLFKGRRLAWVAGVALIGIFLVGASNRLSKEAPVQTASKPQAIKFESAHPVATESAPELTAKLELQPEPETPEEVFHWVEGEVSKNQSLSHLMSSNGIPLATVSELVKQSRPIYNLNRLRAGQAYALKLTSDDRLASFTYQTDEGSKLFIEREGDGFTSRLIEPAYEIKTEILEGVIHRNLISAILEAGGTYQVALDLENIFAWQINFFKDLRKGDSFKILIEKKFLEGKSAGFGNIKAATFKNRDDDLAAVYFKPEGRARGGYYTPDGKSLKRQFLKSPLKYTRISSGFTQDRFHPIYKKHLSHKAVDYAAPTGTPIYAVSDGEVLSLSYNSRSGTHIKLKHPNGYVSSYSHLSGYGPGMSRGKKVVQAQVIGYVGSTGAATGPHLCFRLRKNGKSINPLTFKSPGGPDLNEKSREAFLITALEQMQILDHPESLKTAIS